jgi:hypothetical protein
MVSFKNSGIRDVRTQRTGIVIPCVADGRIPFGAAVIRSDTYDRVKTAILENTVYVLGFALGDETEHTYDGFYEDGEPVGVAITGSVNALVAASGNVSLVKGDYLEIIDITTSTMASGVGVLEEAGSSAGEARSAASVAKVLEDVTLTSATYKAPASTPTAGDTTITMTSGDTTLMGLRVGDYIIIRDSDGTTAQINRVIALTDTTITTRIPITVAAADYIHAIRQAEVLILHGA